MLFSWSALPRELAAPLLKGSVGKDHLLSMARIAMELGAKQPASGLGPMGLEMARAALEGDFLDGLTAGQLASMHEARPFLPTPCYKIARVMAMSSRAPENTEELNQHLARRDFDESVKYVKSMRRKEPDNAFWARVGMLVGFTAARPDWLLEWIALFDKIPRPVREAVTGDILFSAGEYGLALEKYAKAAGALPVLLWRERLGEAALRLGDRERALEEWRGVLAARPWHANLVLRASDVERGADRPGPLPEGRGAALLYTWNKAVHLRPTLQRLAESNLGDAAVLVLDNGSTDSTPQVLAEYAAVFGGRMRTVTLPCNVGAPAARNWLLSLPETRALDWAAFLDDDASVPPDWLEFMGRAMREHPGHPVYGCRVADHAKPMFLQCADLHLEAGGRRGTPDGGRDGLEPAHIKNFELSSLHHQVLDFGQFSYARPCASVTGCCHLFRRAALDEAGHFDLRFSPSQYDDLEHDIRHMLKNGLPLYQGHLRITHMKCSGMGAWSDHAQLMSAWANMYKLQTKYSPEEFERARNLEHEALLRDMLEKTEPEQRAHG